MKNDYYVYLHKTLDGKPFYVGKGRGKRAWKVFGRSKLWKEASSNGYLVDIYAENLSEPEALELESSLIKTLSDLVNTHISAHIEFEDYSEYFIYDPESPSGLARIKGILGGKGHSHEKGKIGPCGTKTARADGSCHWGITFKNRGLLVHRLVWQLINGEIPRGFVVDHVDGDPLNNKIENLRLITQAENSRNARRAKDNSSGITGVCFQKAGEKNTAKWLAYFTNANGKQIIKHFSVRRLGSDEAFRLACEWRTEQIENRNNQGAGYTERHGT